MPNTAKILKTNIYHKRLKPKQNKFNYNVYYLYANLEQLENLAKNSQIFSFNKFNFLSFNYKNYGFKDAQNPYNFIQNTLKNHGFSDIKNNNIYLITMPKTLGYVFNPVSFWLCFDDNDKLLAVISEVNNTFSETHCYISYKDDKSEILKEDWLTSQKLFHVSPFLKIEGYYQFRFFINDNKEKLSIWINYYDNEGLMLETAMFSEKIDLNNTSLIKIFFQIPLVTLKVITLIHYQALKLVLKKIRYIVKPKQSEIKISR